MAAARPRLIQIPFSHNCVKVRVALELKGIEYDTFDIRPMDRGPVRRSSGQALVPVLEHDGRSISDSTAILRYLEETYPGRPLAPADPAPRAECWVLEDWADRAFMALTRRLAYWAITNTPGAIETLFFPGARGLRRALAGRVAVRAVRRRFRISAGVNRRDEQRIRELAPLAVARLGGRPTLLGDGITVADVALASMAAPLAAAQPAVRDLDAVRALVEWSETVVGSPVMELYRATPEELSRRLAGISAGA